MHTLLAPVRNIQGLQHMNSNSPTPLPWLHHKINTASKMGLYGFMAFWKNLVTEEGKNKTTSKVNGSKCAVNNFESNVLIQEYCNRCLSWATATVNPTPSQITSLSLETSLFSMGNLQKTRGCARTDSKQLTEWSREKKKSHKEPNQINWYLAQKT